MFLRKCWFIELKNLSYTRYDRRENVKRGTIYFHWLTKLSQIISYISLYSLSYAEASKEWAGPISASLRQGNTASNLTCRRFEPKISRSRNERITARPTGWSKLLPPGSTHFFLRPFRFWRIFSKSFFSNPFR